MLNLLVHHVTSKLLKVKVATVDCSYMFRLLQNNHLQALYWTYKKETILNIVSGRDFHLKKLIICVNVYMFLVESPLQI